MKHSGVYFPNLDAVRALACLSVFIAHFFDYNSNHEQAPGESRLYTHFIEGAGPMGVSLFFVLSGFLITYLLLREKDARNTIHIGFFYMKRILRIWPLFILITLTGFFLLPLATGKFNPETVGQHLPWFLTFTNNFDRINTGFTGIGNDSLGILWSVAVEEQFYLLWPLIILLCNKRFFPYLATAIVIGSAVFRFFHRHDPDVLLYHSFSVAGDLAIGGFAAFVGYYSQSFRNFCKQQSIFQRVFVLSLIAFIVFNHHYLLQANENSVWGRLLLSCCFAWLIVDQCFSDTRRLGISRVPLLSKIGTISYGFYCYHMFVIIGMQKFNTAAGFATLGVVVFYVELIVVFTLTYAISWMSYNLFEKKLLRLRSRFDSMQVQKQ